jgi:hypothetical protein
MGFVMLGIATLTNFGINAAIFGMVAHGLITGMLFFIAGSVQERYDTREISRLGGLLVQAPRLGWILGFCAMASLGLPGLAGFWGEFPALLSAYNPAAGISDLTFRVYMVVGAVGYGSQPPATSSGCSSGDLRRVEGRVRASRTCTTCTGPGKLADAAAHRDPRASASTRTSSSAPPTVRHEPRARHGESHRMSIS